MHVPFFFRSLTLLYITRGPVTPVGVSLYTDHVGIARLPFFQALHGFVRIVGMGKTAIFCDASPFSKAFHLFIFSKGSSDPNLGVTL